MISSKTVNYIVWRIEQDLPNLFAELPKNSKKYPNEKADYRRAILADKVEVLTHQYAQALIDLINKGDKDGVRQFIYGLTI